MTWVVEVVDCGFVCVETEIFFVVRTLPPGTFSVAIYCVLMATYYDGEQTPEVEFDVLEEEEISVVSGVEMTVICFSCQLSLNTVI